MAKATHNGNCQCCGRSQAVNAKTQKIAKHGYTVDWGFFNGQCAGSDKLPLQLDRTITDSTIKHLREFAAEMEALTPAKTLKVRVERREENKRVWGKIDRWIEMMDREQFEAFKATSRSYRNSTFEDLQENTCHTMKRQGVHAAKTADELAQMADKLHGTDLIERESEQPIKRVYCKDYRDAYNVKQELADEGKRSITSRKRSINQGGGFVVTYRD